MTIYFLGLCGTEPVSLPELRPNDVIVFGTPYRANSGTLTLLLQPPPTALKPTMPALAEFSPVSKPNRGPYASHQPWKKGKKR